jgi:hypothetical protein
VLVGAVAPVAAAPAIVELAIVALALFLIACRRAWVATFGKLLHLLAAKMQALSISVPIGFGKKVGVGLGFVGDVLLNIDGTALRILGLGIDATDWAAKTLWYYIAYYTAETGRVMGDAFEQTYKALWHATNVTLPHYTGVAIHPLASKIEWLMRHRSSVSTTATTIVKPVTRIIDPKIGALEREVKALATAVAAAGAAVPVPGIPVRIPSLGGIRHGIAGLWHEVGRLSKLLTPAGVLGLVMAALVRLGLGKLSCRNVKRGAERVCGMDADLLESLLADTLIIFGTISLVEAAKDMQAVTGELADVTRWFWRAG